MPRAMRVNQHQVEIGEVEGGVVVAAIPDNHVRLCFGGGQDPPVVDPGIDHHALIYQRLIFFPLLNGAVLTFKILIGGEPLNDLPA